MMSMNLRHRRKANANSTFTHILALIHTLYIPALRRPTGMPYTHTHTIFRTGGFSISWQLVLLVFTDCQWCTTLNSNANNQQNRDASSRPLELNTHMHVNRHTTAMSDLLWCSVASQDIIVQCSENKKLEIYRALCVIILSVSGRQMPLFPNLISLVLREIHRETSSIPETSLYLSLLYHLRSYIFFWPGGKDEWHEIQRIRHLLL